MTLTLNKSAIDALPYNFADAVDEFIAAKEAHRFDGNAAPTAEPLVESAVKRVQYPVETQKPDDFVRDYEIIDDTPAPHVKTLDEKKREALEASRQQERAEIEAVSPVYARRLMDMQYGNALGVKEEDRSDEQRTLIESYTALQSKIRAIELAGAIREAAIANLTE